VLKSEGKLGYDNELCNDNIGCELFVVASEACNQGRLRLRLAVAQYPQRQLSDVVFQDKVLISRCLGDKKNHSLGLGLETKSLRTYKTFALVITDQSVLHF